jgi:hypothetical protein
MAVSVYIRLLPGVKVRVSRRGRVATSLYPRGGQLLSAVPSRSS